MSAEVRSTACDGNPPFFFFTSLSTPLLSSLRSFLSFRSFLLLLSDSRLAFAFSRLGPPQSPVSPLPSFTPPRCLQLPSIRTPCHSSAPVSNPLAFLLTNTSRPPRLDLLNDLYALPTRLDDFSPVMPFFIPPAFSDIDDSLNPQIPLCPLSRAHLSQT